MKTINQVVKYIRERLTELNADDDSAVINEYKELVEYIVRDDLFAEE